MNKQEVAKRLVRLARALVSQTHTPYSDLSVEENAENYVRDIVQAATQRATIVKEADIVKGAKRYKYPAKAIKQAIKEMIAEKYMVKGKKGGLVWIENM